MINSKTKDNYGLPAPFGLRSLVPQAGAAAMPRRDLLETKRSILKKLSLRIGKKDCFC
jgi:hypothetical protein